MPRGDGTGPRGLGSMTGRGLGYCAGYSTPGYMTGGWGMGMGWGRGRGGWGLGMGWGRGWRWRVPLYNRPVALAPTYSPVTPGIPYTVDKETELDMLKKEKEFLETSLNNLAKRIEELHKEE